MPPIQNPPTFIFLFLPFLFFYNSPFLLSGGVPESASYGKINEKAGET